MSRSNRWALQSKQMGFLCGPTRKENWGRKAEAHDERVLRKRKKKFAPPPWNTDASRSARCPELMRQRMEKGGDIVGTVDKGCSNAFEPTYSSFSSQFCGLPDSGGSPSSAMLIVCPENSGVSIRVAKPAPGGFVRLARPPSSILAGATAVAVESHCPSCPSHQFPVE